MARRKGRDCLEIGSTPGKQKLGIYTLEDYQLSRSDQVLSPQRLKQLDRVSSPELAPLKEKLLQTALAGYQEVILSDLWCDVKQNMQRFRVRKGENN